jgi:predicted dehydrogenase
MNASDTRLPLAIIGVGHFGRFHALKAAANARVRLVGLADADAARAAAVAAEAGTQVLAPEAAIGAAAAVIVAAPTRFHHGIAMAALGAGRHVFIEKPIAATLAEADALIDAARGRVLQVGHIERFSAAFRAVVGAETGGRALSWDAIRVAPFRPRSLDVSVVLDLMIHDIDLVLELAGGEPEAVEAVGSAVASDLPDFAVARLRFAGGRAGGDHGLARLARHGTPAARARHRRRDERELPRPITGAAAARRRGSGRDHARFGHRPLHLDRP